MPTPTGLPKVGEVWERTFKLPPDWKPNVIRFVVLERGRGEYWSLRVYVPKARNVIQSWVDPAYWFQRGELKYIGPAGPDTRRKLGLL
jgi:hypothetical protein